MAVASFSVRDLGESTNRFYRDNGYLVLESGLSSEELTELHSETVALCRGDRGTIGNYQPPPANVDDDQLLSNVLCIHQAHRCSDILFRYLAQPNVVRVLTGIVGPNVKCMQSMLFIKSANKPGQAWHQDEDFIPTRDRSLVGAWMALDDATVQNGCLWIIPGSHRTGVLWPQYPHNDPRFDCTVESFDFPYRDEDAIPVEVARGSIVFFNGYTLHRSLPNTAAVGTYRRALVNHYMSAESLLPWRYDEGKPMAKQDYRGIVMVAGEDPYAYKGTVKGSQPHIRAAGDGGCGDGRMTLEEFKLKGMPKKAML